VQGAGAAYQLRVLPAFLDDPDPLAFAITCCALLSAADQDSLIPDPFKFLFFVNQTDTSFDQKLSPILYINNILVYL
jgi:hypothetical protein